MVFDTRLHVSAALAGLSVKVMPVCTDTPTAGLKFEVRGFAPGRGKDK
jgi:hypothetical protein